MKGKKYDVETKEKALALLAVNTNMVEISRVTKIPRTTLMTWKANAIIENDDCELVRLRHKKREEFINNAWKIIEKALMLADRRVTTALTKEEAFAVLIEEIGKDEELHQKTKESIINKLRQLQVQGLRDISTFLGTLYDKAALAAGDPTSRVEANMSFEQMLRQIEDEN